MNPPRRAVASLNAEQRSCVHIDGPSSTVIWSTGGLPADNSGLADAGSAKFKFPVVGTQFSFHDFPPGTKPYMHATDTIDYVVIAAGEIEFVTETGTIRLRAGDTLVNRGIVHGWRNDSDTTCRIITTVCEARPVGKGGTL
jgi:quercetin dioxygenase-like cupin family protein